MEWMLCKHAANIACWGFDMVSEIACRPADICHLQHDGCMTLSNFPVLNSKPALSASLIISSIELSDLEAEMTVAAYRCKK